jgi:hypothetical protein
MDDEQYESLENAFKLVIQAQHRLKEAIQILDEYVEFDSLRFDIIAADEFTSMVRGKLREQILAREVK